MESLKHGYDCEECNASGEVIVKEDVCCQNCFEGIVFKGTTAKNCPQCFGMYEQSILTKKTCEACKGSGLHVKSCIKCKL